MNSIFISSNTVYEHIIKEALNVPCHAEINTSIEFNSLVEYANLNFDLLGNSIEVGETNISYRYLYKHKVLNLYLKCHGTKYKKGNCYISPDLYYEGSFDILNSSVYKEIMSLPTMVNSPANKLYMIVMSTRGDLYLKSFKIESKIDIDLTLNYNDDFLDIHNLISQRVEKSTKGIIMLHGLPGTGKTSYIKWFLQNTPKKVVFLPPNLANQLSSPSFVDFLCNDCKDSLLVIEDAENVLESRRSGGNEAVSNLLNITDGLLSDIFNIQILATFNCKLSAVDSALKRKGRIIAEYEFKELKKDKAQKLSDSLGFNSIIEKDTVLTDIFNQNERDFTNKIKRAGF